MRKLFIGILLFQAAAFAETTPQPAPLQMRWCEEMPTWQFLIASQTFEKEITKIATGYKTDEDYIKEKKEYLETQLSSQALIIGFGVIPIAAGAPILSGVASAAGLQAAPIVQYWIGSAGREEKDRFYGVTLSEIKTIEINYAREDFKKHLNDGLLPALTSELAATEGGREFLTQFGHVTSVLVNERTARFGGFETDIGGRKLEFFISSTQTGDILQAQLIGAPPGAAQPTVIVNLDIGLNTALAPTTCTWNSSEKKGDH